MGLDCLVIGYNEPPFDAYEALIRQYGKDSEAYRDLHFSFLEIDGRPRTYVEVLNDARGAFGAAEPFYSGAIPNLAAAYLTSFLRKRGLTADYINLFQLEKEKLARCLAEQPRCVAITTTFYVINVPVIDIVQFIRAHNPTVPIVVGGPLVANHARKGSGPQAPVLNLQPGAPSRRTIDPEFEAALVDLCADLYVVEGQGEQTLARVIEALRDGSSLAAIPNLVYQENGRFFRTMDEAERTDMDTVDIDWAALSTDRLGRTIQMRTARSCAFNCSFCNYPARAGKLTLAGIDTIAREMDTIRARGDVQNLVFIDDTFNVPLARFKDICRLMIRERYGFNWYSYFRCSNSDPEAFDLMAESGCKGVFLGIESGSPTILKNMNKAATIEKYRDGIGHLRQRGILTFGSFILGFPGETAATIQETSDFITTTGLDYYRAQLWYCERGTPIERKRDEYGIEGEGFVWSHATMDSLTAMDHIERLFLTVRTALWLPQWSFDFWIIPYLRGEGVSHETFRRFMEQANRLLALQIASVDPRERARQEAECINAMRAVVALATEPVPALVS